MKRQMRKRRITFLTIVSLMAIGAIVVSGCGRSKKEDVKSDECVIVVEEVAEEKDYIIDIPLSCELQEELHEACEEFGVDYYTMIALIEKETDFTNKLGDSGESYGYCQIQPKWWYGLMVEIDATDLTEPKDNFRTACAIVARLTEKYQSLEGALVAYNQGQYKGCSTDYSREIIKNARRYRA